MSLIQTKLHQPYAGEELITRSHLIGRLNQGLHRKLTLVSAQAGAGKTTLLAQWFKKLNVPVAWYSIDQRDNELLLFTSYLCAAIEAAAPRACSETLGLLRAIQEPSLGVIASTLINELHAQFKENAAGTHDEPRRPSLVLALDDYHHLTEPSIHELVSELIAYQPPGLHVVITSRVDPPLPLAQLRARSELEELRTADLRFTREEAKALLEQTCHCVLDSEAIQILESKTEGWVAGLRLAGLSLRDAPDVAAFVKGFGGTSSAIIVDYLLDEVLEQQPPIIQTFLLQTSVLEQFCAELCDHVLQPPKQVMPATSASADILRELAASNLFLVPLDPAQIWFRYQHLFRDLLQLRARRQYGDEAIRELHARASDWLLDDGSHEAALDHALLAEDEDRAVRVVTRVRPALMNRAQWTELERYYRRFASATVERQPELQMLNAWLHYHRGHLAQVPHLLQEFELTLAKHSMPLEGKRHLEGEASALWSLLAYYSNNVDRSAVEAQKALQNTASELWIVRVLARLFLAGVYQIRGETSRAFEVIYQGSDEEVVHEDRFTITMLVSVCNLHWVTADLAGMSQAASRVIDLSNDLPAAEIKGYAHDYLGRVSYMRNQLAEAEVNFTEVVRQPYMNYGDGYVDSAYGLALTHLAYGRDVAASEVVESTMAYVLDTGNTTLLHEVMIMKADIAVRSGRLGIAKQWADQIKHVPPLSPMTRLLKLPLTLARIWLAEDTPASVEQASELLHQLKDYVESSHNDIVLIEVLAMLAALQVRQGNRQAALISLGQALSLAEPGAIVRPFVDLGPSLQPVFLIARAQGTHQQHVEKILAAFTRQALDAGEDGATNGRRPSSEIPEPLTAREMDVLLLLARRLSNKQIAQELVVSPATVKSHTLSIYAKLNVHGRWQAVNRATELGLLSEP